MTNRSLPACGEAFGLQFYLQTPSFSTISAGFIYAIVAGNDLNPTGHVAVLLEYKYSILNAQGACYPKGLIYREYR
jgi:opacity protein-like surface antigen